MIHHRDVIVEIDVIHHKDEIVEIDVIHYRDVIVEIDVIHHRDVIVEIGAIHDFVEANNVKIFNTIHNIFRPSLPPLRGKDRKGGSPLQSSYPRSSIRNTLRCTSPVYN